MRDDDRVRVLHMIDAAVSLEQFVAGKKRSDLETDRMLLFAVIRAIVWKTITKEIPTLLRLLRALVENH